MPDLIIVDEVDRLKMAGLEQLRDIYDRKQVGLVLLGMPGLAFCPTAAKDAEALVAIMRITQENFRLIERLFTQIARCRTIKQLPAITVAVIEAACESLVIGVQ